MSFCNKCGTKIENGEAFCPNCGAAQNQTNASAQSAPQPVIVNIQNSNANANANTNAGYVAGGVKKSKWTSFFLCLFLGFCGAHKFYEGKIGTGLLYLCTAGLFFIGWITDLFNLLGKPDPYYV